ncbi:aminoimidazole riboside kinase [Microbacterium sediminicola]|uniref:Aminoimidazole riboside kinase n=1 Tax=Microbacterium sediminicola TaxID=415210 RepID=A0ABP4U6M6_9MICO
MNRVVVIGDALIDELRDENGVREFVGGAGLNVAVGLQRLGVPATLIAMVGDDESGVRIRTALADHGVELLACTTQESGRAVSVRADGEPTYSFNSAAVARRVEFGETERRVMADAPAIVVSSYPFDDEEQEDALLRAVREAGSPLIVDPNPRWGLLRDRDAFAAGLLHCAGGADLVKIGDDDAAMLWGEDVDVAAARLREAGAQAVLVTRGAAGATIVVDDGEISRPATPLSLPIVDTMGAGDATLAAAVAELVRTTPASLAEWGHVLEAAMDAAAATCRVAGALLRSLAEVHSADLEVAGS